MTSVGAPVRLHAAQFEKLTGARVDVTYVPFGRYYEELIWGLRRGTYDVVFYGQVWLPDTHEYLAPVPRGTLDSPRFQNVDKPQRDAAFWHGIFYNVPIDGDRHMLQYRADLLADPNFGAEFKQRYKRQLGPPATWKELRDVAEFFHGREISPGHKIYGIAEITCLDDADFLGYVFIKRSAPYVKHPAVKGGVFFDIETMKPLINTPGFVEALKDFIAIQDFSLPKARGVSFEDHVRALGDGQVVFTDSWEDPFIYAMRPEKICGKVAVAPSPGSRKVWNRKEQRWDIFPDVNVVPYLCTSWTSAVAKSCPHTEAAFQFLGFFGNSFNHSSDLLHGRYGINPFCRVDMATKFWAAGAGWSQATAGDYVRTQRLIAESPNRIYDLTIYLGRQYLHSLAVGVRRALTHRDSPRVALDSVAKRWGELTRRVGVDKQRRAYARTVRLEDTP